MKRVSYRRQKRWWNAYLLYYTRLDDSLTTLMSDLTLGEFLSISVNEDKRVNLRYFNAVLPVIFGVGSQHKRHDCFIYSMFF